MTWEKNKEIILVVLFVAVVALLYYFGILNILSQIDVTRNNLKKTEFVQETQKKKLDSLSVLRADFETVIREEAKIQPLLNKGSEIDLIREIESLADSSGNSVKIEVLKEEAKAKSAAKTEAVTILDSLPSKDYIQLKINVAGSFFDLISFLNKLENCKYYLDVISLQIGANTEDEAKSPTVPVAKNPFVKQAVADELEQALLSRGVISNVTVVVYTQK